MPPAAAKVIASNAVKEALTELVPEFERAKGPRGRHHSAALDISARIAPARRWISRSCRRADRRASSDRAGSNWAAASTSPVPASSCGCRRQQARHPSARHSKRRSWPQRDRVSSRRAAYLAGLFSRWASPMRQIKMCPDHPGRRCRSLSRSHDLPEKVPLSRGQAFRDHALARGEGEIGFTQVSELQAAPGIDYVGPLPAEVQHITVWSAALHAAAPAAEAAAALVEFLRAPHAAAVIKRSGMEPG